MRKMRINKKNLVAGLLLTLLTAALVYSLDYLGFLIALTAAILVGSYYLERVVS